MKDSEVYSLLIKTLEACCSATCRDNTGIKPCGSCALNKTLEDFRERVSFERRWEYEQRQLSPDPNLEPVSKGGTNHA
jgi:hypothetical protein